METVNFTSFDFETATYSRMPCQLGLVVVREGKIVEETLFMIKPPENKYDIGCTRIHGITAKDTESCKEFDELRDEIEPYFHNELAVAHNVGFDYDVLNKACRFYDLDEIRAARFVDTMSLFDNRSLSDVTIALGIEMDNHHNALSDARACARIYIEFCKGVDFNELQYPIKKKRRKYFENEDRVISKYSRIQDLSIAEDVDHPFYDKTIVISGVFEKFPIRNDLALHLKRHGAKINGDISSKTNYFIIGSDYGPKKMEKVKQMQLEGIDIKIFNEDDLLNIQNLK